MSDFLNFDNDLATYRYERKFSIPYHARNTTDRILRSNPASFREVYQPRYINNIYYDTLYLKHYNENIEGLAKRAKIRIRWYGELIRHDIVAQLELKCKQGEIGFKQEFPLPVRQLHAGFSKNDLISWLTEANVTPGLKYLLSNLQPILINRYYRRYFLSADGCFRATIDTHLEYFPLYEYGNRLNFAYHDHNKTVLELKYAPHLDSKASAIGRYFPYRLDKSSKYIDGVEFLHAPYLESDRSVFATIVFMRLQPAEIGH